MILASCTISLSEWQYLWNLQLLELPQNKPRVPLYLSQLASEQQSTAHKVL